MYPLFSTENRIFMSLVGQCEIGKSQDKIYFFNQHSEPLHDVIQRVMESLEFVRGVNFEPIDSLKNNSTKCLLIYDNFFEESCISKAIADIASAGRHR